MTTQVDDELFDESFHEWLMSHGGMCIEARDNGSDWSLDLNELKYGLLVWRERYATTLAKRMALEARLDEITKLLDGSRGTMLHVEPIQHRLATLQSELKDKRLERQ